MKHNLGVPQTSPSLLLRIRDSRDEVSWQTFQETYLPIILAWCQLKGASVADAEDVAQETMSAVARAIKSFDYTPGRGRFRAWLGTITANELKTHMAKKHQNCVVSLSASSQHRPYSDPDTDWVVIYANRIFRSACRRIRDLFEPVTWQCFELTWVARKPAAEVAEALNIPIHSVYVNKSRVLKRLETEVLHLAEMFLPVDFESTNDEC